MKANFKLLVSLTVFFTAFIFVNNAKAQCNIDIPGAVTDTIHICQGDQVTLTSSGDCADYLMANDFNDGTIGTGWSSNASPMFNNPCGPGPDGSICAWIGDATCFPRELVTVPYDVTTSCQICFDMRYAIQGQGSPCEGPDLTNEGVHLQYSTNGGATWTDINYWDPNGGNDPNLTNWGNYCESVPVNGTGVQFRWFQDVTSGNGYDHWGIDNVFIYCPPPSQTVTWSGCNGFTYGDFNPPTFAPTCSGWYSVNLTDNTYDADDSVYVLIHPTPTLYYNFPSGTICSNGGTITFNGVAAPPSPTVSGSNSSYTGTGVTDNGNGTATFDPATAGAGTHTISFTYTDLCSHSIDTTITVVDPPTATFTAQSPVCEGDISHIVYTGTGNSGDTYVWDFDWGNTIVSGTGQGPYDVYWTGPGVRTITLHVVAANGCTSATYSQQVMVLDAGTPNCCLVPEPDAGPDNNGICGLSYTMQGSQPDPGNTATWTVTNAPVGGTANISPINDSNATVTVTLEGTYTFEWHENAGNCDSSDFVTLTFYEQPLANAGLEGGICGLTYDLQAIPSLSGSTGTWSGSGTFSPSNSPNTTVTVGSYGSYEFIWTETNGVCSDQDTVPIIFMSQPNANAGVDTTVCGNSVPLHAGNNGVQHFWLGPAGTIYTPDYQQNIVSATIPSITGTSQTEDFIWYVSNGYCDNSDTVTITFLAVPTPYAGLNQEICNQTTQLTADTIGMSITTLNWTADIPGVSISDANIPNPDVSIASMVPTIYGDSGQVTVWFYLNTYNSQGCGSTDSVSVIFYQVPEAYAGEDDSLCGLEYNLQAQFDLVNNHSQGQWNYIASQSPAGAVVNFVNDTVPTSTVQVSTYGFYYFVWSEWNRENNNCRDYDTVVIQFIPYPNIDCGADFSVCGKWAELNVITSTGIGQWNATGGAAYASYPSIDSLNSAYQDSATAWVYHATPNQTVTFYWTEYNSICVSVDSVNVYFAGEIPAVPFVQDSTNCGLVFDNLDAQTPQYGYGYWMDTVNNSQFYDTSATPHPDSVVVSYYGMHHFYWIVNNGACIDTSDAIPILFVQNPIANAGGNYWPGLFGAGSEIKTDTACGYNYYLGAQPTIGLGTWYTTDQINTWFLNPDSISPDSTATHNPNDTAHTNILTYNANPDYYDFVWVEDNDYGCTDQDTLRLFFAPVPTGDFTVTTPWCIGYPSTIIAHTSYNQIQNDDWGLINFNWGLDNGIVDTTGGVPPNGLDEDTIFVHWDNGAPSHIVSLLTTSIYGCSSPINFDTIVEPPKMNPDYDIEDGTCGLANGIITLYTDTHELTYTWDSTFAAPNDTIQQGLLGGQTYTVLVHGESSSPDAPQGTICTDTLSIYLPDVGYTTALFDTLIPDGVAPYPVSVTNLSINGRNYEWFVYDQNNQLVWSGTDEFPTFTINQEGYYHILLISTSRDDCRDTMEWGEFYVEASSKMEVPNVFTPNGDNTNDYFQVVAKTLSDFHGIITNRWGKKLYEWDNWKDKEAGWNGKIGNSLATPGAYFYIIKATGKDGTEYDLQGTFYLLREKQ